MKRFTLVEGLWRNSQNKQNNQLWRYLACLLLFMCLGVGNVLGETLSTTTYGTTSHGYLDISKTTSNGTITASGTTVVTFGANYLKGLSSPTWYSCNADKSDTDGTGGVTVTNTGFLPNKGSSGSSFTRAYSYLKIRSSKPAEFWVTGTTGVAIIGKGAGDSKKLTLSVKEVAADGTTLSAVGTDLQQSNTVAIISHASVLDPSKYYKIIVSSTTDDNTNFYQIRFSTPAPTTVADTPGANGTISFEYWTKGGSNLTPNTTTYWKDGIKLFQYWATTSIGVSADRFTSSYSVPCYHSNMTANSGWGSYTMSGLLVYAQQAFAISITTPSSIEIILDNNQNNDLNLSNLKIVKDNVAYATAYSSSTYNTGTDIKSNATITRVDAGTGRYKIELSVSASDLSSSNPYIIKLYNTSDGSNCAFVYESVTVTSCTAPNHVEVTGTNKYLGGQTVSLTATAYSSAGTGSPIADANIESYQWQKKISGVWTNISNGSGISGATTNNLQISSCTHENSGGYRCIVSTGDDCDTKSHADGTDGYGVHVYSIYGGYYGESWSHNEIQWESGTSGTATVNLSAKKVYMFRVYSNNGNQYGNGSGNYIVQPVDWDCGTGNYDIRLFTGPSGDYTFTVDIEHGLDGTPYVNVQVDYPDVTHPSTGYVYVRKYDWNCYVHYWKDDKNVLTTWGYDPQITTYANVCGNNYWYFPVIDTYTNFIAKDAAGDPGNTTAGRTTISNEGKHLTHNGVSWEWNSFTTHTISFDANKGSGSMSSVTNICNGADVDALPTNTFTRTGWTFVGWNTDKYGGGTSYADGATISNITSNITLYAQWQRKIYFYSTTSNWYDDDAKTQLHCWDNDDNTKNLYVTMTRSDDCSNPIVYEATIPGGGYDKLQFKRLKSDESESWNETVDLDFNSSYNMYKLTNMSGGAGDKAYGADGFDANYSAPSQYTITFAANGGSDSMSAIEDICEGTDQDLTANSYTKTGYGFDGWKTNAALTYVAYGDDDDGTHEVAVEANDTVPDKAKIKAVGSNIKMTATWTAQQYKITYRDQGDMKFSGLYESGKPTTHTYGSETILKTAFKDSYVFGGWYTSSDCSTGLVTTIGATDYTANFKLYAKWTEMSMGSLAAGTLYKVGDMVPKGYTVGSSTRYYPGVSANNLFNIRGRSTSADSTYAGMASKTIKKSRDVGGEAFTAELSFRKPASGTDGTNLGTGLPNNHAIQFKISGDGLLDIYCNHADSIFMVKDGGSAAVLSASNEAQKVTKEVTEGTYYLYSTHTGSNQRLYGLKFTPTYTVTLNTNGGTINAGNVTSYNYGTGATLPTDVTKSGYVFAGWYDNSGLTGDAVTTIADDATGNKAYWAKWTEVVEKCETLNTSWLSAYSTAKGEGTYGIINGVKYDIETLGDDGDGITMGYGEGHDTYFQLNIGDLGVIKEVKITIASIIAKPKSGNYGIMADFFEDDSFTHYDIEQHWDDEDSDNSIATESVSTGDLSLRPVSGDNNSFAFQTYTADLKISGICIYYEPAPSSEKQLLGLKFSNGFDAFIDETYHTVTAYYLYGTDAPTVSSYTVSDEASYSKDGTTITVTAEDGSTQDYTLTLSTVTPYAGTGSEETFTGSEPYIKGGVWEDSEWNIRKNSDADSRQQQGLNRLYFFIDECSTITLTSSCGNARNIYVYRNGTKLDSPTSIGTSGATIEIAGSVSPALYAILPNGTNGDIEMNKITITPNCTDPGLAFASASKSVTLCDDAPTNALTNTHGVTVSYTSSNTSVATVASDGAITLKGAGETTITASSSIETVSAVKYCADEATYTITVASSTAAGLSYSSTSVEKDYGASNFTNTLTNSNSLTGVTYESSVTTVATVDEETGEVTIVGPGTTTITASSEQQKVSSTCYAAGDASYTLTVYPVYTVSYNAMGGTCSPTTKNTTTVLGKVTLPSATNSTYDLVWVESDGTPAGGAGDKYGPTEAVTLYAKWKGNCAGGGSGISVRFTSSNKNDAGNAFADMSTSSNTTQMVGSGTAKLIAIGSASLNDANNKIGYRDDGRLNVVFKFSEATTLDIYFNANSTSKTFKLSSFSSNKALKDIATSDYSSRTAVTSGITVAGAAFASSGKSTTSGAGSASSGVITLTTTGGIKVTYSSLAAGCYVFEADGSGNEGYLYGYDLNGGGSTCYTVTYDGNGADGGYTNDPTQYTSGQSPEILDCGYTKTSYAFIGWADGTDHRDAGTVDYQPGDHITSISDDVTLYAIWKQIKYFIGAASTTSWNTDGNWSPSGVPAITDPVVIRANVTVDTDEAKALSVDIEAGNTLTIGAGQALIIEKTLTKAGGATAAADVIINSDRTTNGVGALVIGGETGTNKATVNFESKVNCKSGDVNQYIGSPFSDEIPYVDYAIQMYKFAPTGTGSHGWWNKISYGDRMDPFMGYNLLTNDKSIDFLDLNGRTGHLNASSNMEMTIANGKMYYNSSWPENMFANGWLAPIHIDQFVDDDFVNVKKVIYIFNAGTPEQYEAVYGEGANSLGAESGNEANEAPGTYTVIPVKSASELAELGAVTKVIPSMQAFSVLATNSSPELKLNFKRLVYDPAVDGGTSIGIEPTRAPRRMASDEDRPDAMRIRVRGENGWTANAYVLGREDFTDGYDDGWDGEYMEGDWSAPQLYSPTGDGSMVVNCVPEIEGTVIAFHAGSVDNNYTFSFVYNGENTWYLNDLREQKSVRIDAAQTYSFASASGDVAARFIISKTPIAMTPTGTGDIGDSQTEHARKVIIDDHVYIIRNGKMYNATGSLVK